MPQVIVIDEIGTKLEAMAASTIAQRGIQLVATAHGVTIENLVMNPALEMLVGGVQVFFILTSSHKFTPLKCLKLIHYQRFSGIQNGVQSFFFILFYSCKGLFNCSSFVLATF